MQVRNNNHRFRRRNGKFIIFRESPGIIEPRKSTFNNPTPGKFFPLMRLDFFRDIYTKTQFLVHIRHKCSSISSICAEFMYARITHISFFCSGYTTFCIMHICSMDVNRKHTPQNVYHNMSFSSFRFFPPSIPRSSLASVVFTLCESIIA